MAFNRVKYMGLASFRAALRRFLSASEDICKDGGITSQQYQAILAIGCSEAPLTMKGLAEQLLLQSHAAVQMVNRLDKVGLVKRTPSPDDGRSVILILTSAGETLLDTLAANHLKEVLKQAPLLTQSFQLLKQSAEV